MFGKSKAAKAVAASKPYHCMDLDRAAIDLDTDTTTGLSTSEAERRLTVHGPNEMRGGGRPSALKILFRQLANLMTLILIAAVAIAFAIKDWIEAGVVIGVIVVNTAVGFAQEFKAEKTMDSLRKMTSPTSRVLRNGHQIVAPTADLVPGDIIYLESGDVVGADCRLFDIFNLEADEALLTGEALPIAKEAAPFDDPELPLGDRINLSYASTTITKGRAKGLVYATGMGSEVGKIAKKLMESDKPRKTPLQKALDRMSWVLLAVAIASVLIVFGANKFNIRNEVLLYAIGLAIATIPEGLIAVVTLTMSLGVHTLAKKRALVRKLVALESLGSVTNICSDKTGTLTQSKMVLVRAWLPAEGFFRISGLGFEPVGDVTKKQMSVIQPTDDQRVNFVQGSDASRPVGGADSEETVAVTASNMSAPFRRLVEAAALCNMSEIKQDAETGDWFGIGDPTEVALQVFASKLSMGKPVLTSAERGWQLVCEYPFDSDIKRMSVAAADAASGEQVVILKGATERVVPCCTGIQDGASIVDVAPDALLSQLDPKIQEMARDGLRVLSIAYRRLTSAEEDSNLVKVDRKAIEAGMVFVGLVGIYDPPRPESFPSVMECYRAGIQVTMLTGDHPQTAAAIARQVGILQDEDSMSAGADAADSGDHKAITLGQPVMTAREFDRMSVEEIDALPELPCVIARCSPDTKVKMIEAMHRRGGIVAMTGDGVNDSPSLKFADVGIAMGMTGSDVAKQASEIILTDDNFATIVRAIREGRRVFSNIQRFCCVLVSGNVAEMICLLVGLAFKDKLGETVFPLSPVAILVNNLLTGTPPAMALGVEKAWPTIMDEPPRPSSSGLFTWEVLGDIAFFGTSMGLLSIADFWIVVNGFGDGNMGEECNREYSESCDLVFRARGTVFATLTLAILLHSYNCRRIRGPMWNWTMLKRFYENKFLFAGVVAGTILCIICMYVPGLNTGALKMKGISWEWGVVLITLLVFLILSEIYKFAKRRLLKPISVATQEQERLQRIWTENTLASSVGGLAK